MDTKSLWITLQTYWVRVRGWFGLLLNLLYIGLFLTGVYVVLTGDLLGREIETFTVGKLVVTPSLSTLSIGIILALTGIALGMRSTSGGRVIGDEV